MTRVKICGLMNEEDVHMCAKAGADAVGFVTEYPISVPWNISRDKTRDLAASTPPFLTTTAVVGGPVETILIPPLLKIAARNFLLVQFANRRQMSFLCFPASARSRQYLSSRPASFLFPLPLCQRTEE